MPIPDSQSLMLPVLRLVGDRQEHSPAEMQQRIADELNLTKRSWPNDAPAIHRPCLPIGSHGPFTT